MGKEGLTERSDTKAITTGNRREARCEISVAARIFGTDTSGRIFSENVTTVNVSRCGVEIIGARSNLRLNDTIGISCGRNKSYFSVRWLGEAGTIRAGHAGLLNLTPDKPLWNFPLPDPAPDRFRTRRNDRRRYPRIKIATSVQVCLPAGTSIWCTSTDLSLGGCFVEMPNPFRVGTKLELKLWAGEQILRAVGTVAASTPGLGIGIQFTKMDDKDFRLLSSLLSSAATSR